MTRPPPPAAFLAGLLLAFAPQLHADLRWESRLAHRDAALGDESVPLSFTFSNPSDRPVTITEVEPACGCTAATLAKKTYAPGEHGRLDVTFDTAGLSGSQQKTIRVKTDASPEAITLTLRVNVPVWLEISPRLLWWKIDEPPSPKEILLSPGDPSIRLVSVTSDRPSVRARLEPVSAGRHRLILQPDSTREALQATVTVTTQAPNLPPRHHVVFAQVR